MLTFNFPTTILYGSGALDALAGHLQSRGHQKLLLVTDHTLVKVGLVDTVRTVLNKANISHVVFEDVHPNPVEDDVDTGVKMFRQEACDAIIAVGGGSALDVAKIIKLMAVHDPPLAQYDDALGGDRLITKDMSPLYAVPTTAGTGSEVGRAGVIILRETGRKTIFFAPDLMPDVAVLDPEMTIGLPSHITAATGLDAFTHCLEAYFSPAFHPMADGIALHGIELILENLPLVVKKGSDKEARAKMQLAAAMGATAFQKGLGMIHSLAHPLSAMYGTHHGLANALLLPAAVKFLESADSLDALQREKISRVDALFSKHRMGKECLSMSCRSLIETLGIQLGLLQHDVLETDLEFLADEAYADPCHQLNLFPVTRQQLLDTYHAAL